jgi:AcrR family transcriptional regulator
MLVGKQVCQMADFKESQMQQTLTDQQPPNAKDRIVETALKLFYRDGIRATGIDKIIAESGVAKMSFYRHFPSKAALISEFLRKRHDNWMGCFTSTVTKKLEKRGAGIEVIADVLGEWFVTPGFRGCAFINTISETPDFDAEQNQIVREHKAQLESFVRQIAVQLKVKSPAKVAACAMIIIEGTIVRAQMTRNPEVVSECRHLLQLLSHTETKFGRDGSSRSRANAQN